MRLFEFDKKSSDVSENVLLSILQNLRLDLINDLKELPEKKDPPPISYNALIDMVRAGGDPYFNQTTLERILTTPKIKDLVNSVSDGAVTLRLFGDEPASVEQPSQIPPEKRVEMMAQRAMSRRQSPT